MYLEIEDSYDCLTNLNDYVKENKIINYGMEEEVEKLIQGLMRYKKSNVLIIGKAGIGKTALVEKLAERLNSHAVPKVLRNKEIYEMNLNNAVAGTKYRGEFEEKVERVLRLVSHSKNMILFVDEIHNILELGGAEGAMSFGETLKPYLARNQITLIGATTRKEYEKTIKRDAAFDRRFFKIEMKEPKINDVIKILNSVVKQYEAHYKIRISDEEIKKIVLKSRKRKGCFPDKALDELEEYCYQKAKNKGK